MGLPSGAVSIEPTRSCDSSAPESLLEQLVLRCLDAEDPAKELLAVRAERPELADRVAAVLERLESDAMLTGARTPREVPEQLGEFRLRRQLGAGGMGVVYLAQDEKLNRLVALKLARPELLYFDGVRERFEREVAAVARLRHPNIVPIYTVGEDGGVPYYAMEFVDGETLDRLIKANGGRRPETLEAPFSSSGSESGSRLGAHLDKWVGFCLRAAQQVAEALEHAHEHGILHRDVKPSNIIIDRSGSARLMDFGIARIEEEQQMTRSGALLGSLAYMSPEQLRGQGHLVDQRSDVYSLGVTLFELLSLRCPFLRDDAEATRRRILDGRPPALHRLNTRVPQDVATVCLKAMALERESRYQTAGELVQDLTALLTAGPIRARRVGLPLRARRAAQRHPALSLASVVALMLVTVSAVVVAWRENDAFARESGLRQDAERETYLAAVVAAESTLRVGEAGTAVARLAGCSPDLRGWEWDFLDLRCDSSLASIVVEPELAPHQRSATSLSLHPDDRRLLVGTASGRVAVYDAETQERLADRSVGGYVRGVEWLGESSDAALLTDTEFLVWRVGSGKAPEKLGEAGAGLKLAVTEDGRYAAFISGIGRRSKVEIWDLAARERRRVLPDVGAYSLGFVAGGRRLVLGTYADKLLCFEVGGEAEAVELEGYYGWVAVVSASHDGAQFAAVDTGGVVLIWDAVTLEKQRQVQLGTDPVSLRWSRDERVFLVGKRSHSIELRSSVTGRLVMTAYGHRGVIYGLAESSDATRIYSAASDGTVKVWDARRFGATQVLDRHRKGVTAVCFARGGQQLLTLDLAGVLVASDSVTGAELQRWTGLGGGLRVLAAHPGNGSFAVGGEGGQLLLFDDVKATPKHLPVGDADVSTLAWSGDGRWLVAGSAVGELRLFDPERGILVDEGRTKAGKELLSLAFAGGGSSELFAGDLSGEVACWQVQPLQKIMTLGRHDRQVRAMASLRDGRLLTGGYDGQLLLWSREGAGYAAQTLLSGVERYTSIAVHPEQPRFVVTSLSSPSPRLWDLEQLVPMIALRAHRSGVLGASFSPDGETLATGVLGAEVRLWQTPQARLRALEQDR
ncbi:MAG: serine/threonine-protein kinase [Planctomycetota bacterium]|nr:serine/threonine-protein kinase [Planctomycetota bacterium]